MNKIIYVAVPSAGVFFYDQEKDAWKVNDHFLIALALVHDQNPENVYISPSIQNYEVLPYMTPEDTGPGYEHWKARCRTLLRKCDEVLVFTFPTWKDSKGVTDEMNFATMMGLPIKFFDVMNVVRQYPDIKVEP